MDLCWSEVVTTCKVDPCLEEAFDAWKLLVDHTS